MSEVDNFGFVMPHWFYWGWLAVMPLIMMYLDKRFSANTSLDVQTSDKMDDHSNQYGNTGNTFTRAIDWMCDKSGIFIAFWTINAVAFYVFEVVMRYLFNMPTLWAHEASFLLLGMQYLLAGAYAMLHGSHVRVDIVYNKLPPRGRVGMDIFTSIFFFIFLLALGSTSWRNFFDAYQMSEVSVETWGIQYWPVKGAVVIGSVLLFLAGLSKLLKDITLYCRMGRRLPDAATQT